MAEEDRQGIRVPPPALPDEVFGFWFRGIWQPVLVGVTVEAVDKDNVTFHYPKP